MGRPFLALGLIAVAALLLGSLFAELEDGIRDPEPFTPDAKALEKGAETVAAHPEYLEAVADAGALQLSQDTPITIPPGAAEVDGDMLRLLEDIDWTLPAGTDLEDLTLPLPPGTEIGLPSGTRIEGDTLVFPPDSTITLADGTELHLPEGGRLRIPGADAATLRSHIEDGTFTIPDNGGIFTAPRVHNEHPWPMTLPSGTTFRIPDGFELPEGTWEEGGSFTLPAGHRVAPPGDAPEGDPETQEGLFDKIGKLELKPPEPKEEKRPSGFDAPNLTLPGGTTWLWLLAVVAAAAIAYLAWRHRARLRRIMPSRAAALLGTEPSRHPFRLIAAVDPHPELLPLALAPEAARTLRIRIEAEHPEPETQTRSWHATPAEITARLGEERLFSGSIGPDGAALQIPALPTGDHPLHITIRAPGPKEATLTETLRVAPWAEQVARDYDRLAQAVQRRTRLPDGFTPRVLEAHTVSMLPPAAHTPLSLALTTFERANYSRATIDETEWVRMATTVEGILHALAPARAAPRAAPREASSTPRPDTA